MLRALVALLLLANALTWAYGKGFLGFLGLGIPEQREPLRVQQQVHPEALHVLPPAKAAVAPEAPADAGPTAAAPSDRAAGSGAEAATSSADASSATAATAPATSAPASAPAPSTPAVVPAPPAAPVASAAPVVESVVPKGPKACWEVGGYNAAQAITLNGAMQAQAALAKRWTVEEAVLPARWIVYLGQLGSADALQRRRAELRDAKVAFRDVTVPALQPGLALGTYSTEAAAKQALQDVSRAGVSGAKVVQERQNTVIYILRLPAITDAERRQVDALPALAGRSLKRCS